MLVGNRYSPKLLLICDWCPSMPKSAISVKHPAGKKLLSDKAIRAGWWMRPKVEHIKRGEWAHCCPMCVDRIIASKDKDALRAISSKQFAEYKLG